MNKQIPSLNGLRAMSIIMVIGHHLRQHDYLPDNKIIKYSGMVLLNGQLAVNIFFIISGFLITTLLMNEKSMAGRISLKKFYIRRALRIFPAYYFLVFAYFILQYFNYFRLETMQWIGILTFTKQFLPGELFETHHFWSLSVEEVFYLIWPLIFIRTKNNASVISIILILIITIARIVQFDYPYPPLSNTIFRTGDALLLGCLVAMKYDYFESFVLRYKKYIYLVVPGLILSMLIYFSLFYLMGRPGINIVLISGLHAVAYGLFGNIGIITNLLICFLLIYSINIKNKWFVFLNNPFMVHIGKLSYSIYLWQQLFTSECEFMKQFSPVLLLIATYVMSYFSYRIIEKPFLRYKDKFSIKSQ